MADKYRKITVPCLDANNLPIQRECEIVFEAGPFAVTRCWVNGGRTYTVTHVPTTLKVHTDQWMDFQDGFAAVEFAREMHETFPEADKWTKTNERGELPKRSVVREIVMRHLEPKPPVADCEDASRG